MLSPRTQDADIDFNTEQTMDSERIPLIFDTDLGEDIDDLYALYLALFHPRLEVLAVTTVHGDTQAKARLARKVLRLAGSPEIPVGAGIGVSADRIRRGQTRPDHQASATFVKYVTEADPECGQDYPAASEVIARVLADSPLPVALVSEGAMSNLAEAIRVADESTRAKIRCVAAMAGETQAVLNEYNVICDPEAADYVFNCGLPVFMGTYHLTARLAISMNDVERHFGQRNTPIQEVLYDCTALWAPHRGRKPGPVLYDLVPVFWLADAGVVRTRWSTVRVELDGRYTRGQTIRMGEAEQGNVLESVDLNPEAMVHEFLLIIRAAPGRGVV